jgi:hypothetical protein
MEGGGFLLGFLLMGFSNKAIRAGVHYPFQGADTALEDILLLPLLLSSPLYSAFNPI